MDVRKIAQCCALLALLIPPIAAEAAVTRETALTIAPPLSDKDERNNLSGAACAGTTGTCLMIGDEKRYARFFRIEGDRLVPGPPLYLLGDDNAPGETDGEGVAYAPGAFYIVGSHSRNKDGDPQESRKHLFRLAVDPATGRPADPGTAARPSAALRSVSLANVIAQDPLLRQHLDEAPGEGRHGVNIEGLAYLGGALFLGFRGPVDGEGALLLKIGDPFADTAQATTRYRLPLGAGQGVRDLAEASGGILILSGPEMRGDPPKPELFFWKPGDAPRRLGALPVSAKGDSPEAITVLGETADAWRILVLSDGKSGGEPGIYRVAKPAGD